MRKDIWTLDSETDPFKYGRIPKPFLWGLYNGSEYRQFERTDQVAAFLSTLEGAVVYAHNGGRFDYHFLLDWLAPYSEVTIINGRLSRFNLGLAELRDSFNILPVPLAAYKKDVIDYSIMEADVRGLRANREKIEAYLKADCVYLWDLVTAFVDRYGMHLTQASASLKMWRKFAGEKARHTDASFYDTFKPFYYGGRVQAFERGVRRERFDVADVNSAYPFAMLHRHPYGESYGRTKSRKIKPRNFYKVHCVARGCFPARDADYRLQYPADGTARVYSVTGWELLAALELGLVRRYDVLEAYQFAEDITFEGYILHQYEERQKAKDAGDKAGSLFSKLLMNSLYGKFGADPRRYMNHMVAPQGELQPDDPHFPLRGYIGKWALVEDKSKPATSNFHNVATAASITGFERAVLMRQIAKAEGVLYCDTDCVVARDLGDIDQGPKLGQWTVEAKAFNKWAIAGRKLYSFYFKDDGKDEPCSCCGEFAKHASKGVRLSPAEIEHVARGGFVEYAPEVPTFSLLKPPRFTERDVRML